MVGAVSLLVGLSPTLEQSKANAVFAAMTRLSVALLDPWGREVARGPVRFDVVDETAYNLDRVEFKFTERCDVAWFAVMIGDEEMLRGDVTFSQKIEIGDSAAFAPRSIRIATSDV